MRRLAAAVILSVAAFTAQSRLDVRAVATASLAQIDGEIKVAGLRAPVQVVRDTWGVPHITAQSVDDLFFAQDWDRSQVINVPGQSGQPGSPYYDNLLKLWADNAYFPLAFSQKAVAAAAAHRLVLRP